MFKANYIEKGLTGFIEINNGTLLHGKRLLIQSSRFMYTLALLDT